jgi:hypothetical protein
MGEFSPKVTAPGALLRSPLRASLTRNVQTAVWPPALRPDIAFFRVAEIHRQHPRTRLSELIRNLAIHLFEPCVKASCVETRPAGPKVSEIGTAGRPLFERCSLGGAPLFTLAGLRGFLARRRYVWAISAMQDSRAIVSAMGQHIPQRVLSQPVSIPWVAIRKTVNATPYRHDIKLHVDVRERGRARNRSRPIVWTEKLFATVMRAAAGTAARSTLSDYRKQCGPPPSL